MVSHRERNPAPQNKPQNTTPTSEFPQQQAIKKRWQKHQEDTPQNTEFAEPLRFDSPRPNYRDDKPPNPKIGRKYHPDIQILPSAGDRKIPRNYHENAKNTNCILGVFRGYLKGYFGESLFFVCWGYFEILGFLVLLPCHLCVSILIPPLFLFPSFLDLVKST